MLSLHIHTYTVVSYTYDKYKFLQALKCNSRMIRIFYILLLLLHPVFPTQLDNIIRIKNKKYNTKYKVKEKSNIYIISCIFISFIINFY